MWMQAGQCSVSIGDEGNSLVYDIRSAVQLIAVAWDTTTSDRSRWNAVAASIIPELSAQALIYER